MEMVDHKNFLISYSATVTFRIFGDSDSEIEILWIHNLGKRFMKTHSAFSINLNHIIIYIIGMKLLGFRGNDFL